MLADRSLASQDQPLFSGESEFLVLAAVWTLEDKIFGNFSRGFSSRAIARLSGYNCFLPSELKQRFKHDLIRMSALASFPSDKKNAARHRKRSIEVWMSCPFEVESTRLTFRCAKTYHPSPASRQNGFGAFENSLLHVLLNLNRSLSHVRNTPSFYSNFRRGCCRLDFALGSEQPRRGRQ